MISCDALGEEEKGMKRDEKEGEEKEMRRKGWKRDEDGGEAERKPKRGGRIGEKTLNLQI